MECVTNRHMYICIDNIRSFSYSCRAYWEMRRWKQNRWVSTCYFLRMQLYVCMCVCMRLWEQQKNDINCSDSKQISKYPIVHLLALLLSLSLPPSHSMSLSFPFPFFRANCAHYTSRYHRVFHCAFVLAFCSTFLLINVLIVISNT